MAIRIKAILAFWLVASVPYVKAADISYNETTHALILSNDLRSSICHTGLAPTDKVQDANAIMEGISKFFNGIRDSLLELEQTPNQEQYQAFQNFRAELMSSSPNRTRIDSSRNRFQAVYKRWFVGTPEQAELDSNRVIRNMIAKYASPQAYDLGYKIDMQSAVGKFVFEKDYSTIESLFLMNPEILNSTVRDFLGDRPYEQDFDQEGIPDLISSLNELISETSQIRRSSESLKEDVIELLTSYYFAYLTAVAIDRSYPNTLSKSSIKVLGNADRVINQLKKWADNPKDSICGSKAIAGSESADWCASRDVAYDGQLSRLMDQMSRDARYLKDPGTKVQAVKGYVGINGKQCSLDGNYHLLHLPEGKIILSLNVNLTVITPEGKRMTTHHDESSFSSVVGNRQDFQISTSAQ